MEKNNYYFNIFLEIASYEFPKNRIEVSQGIDINQTSASKECDICHYWYFLNKGFKFHPNVCNRCHDLLIVSMNLGDIYILNIKNVNYCRIVNAISKSEARKFHQHKDLFQ